MIQLTKKKIIIFFFSCGLPVLLQHLKPLTQISRRIISKMAPIRKSEEEVGRIWDRCFVDTAIKSGKGMDITRNTKTVCVIENRLLRSLFAHADHCTFKSTPSDLRKRQYYVHISHIYVLFNKYMK